ncbi:unnamed protein product [Adineta steineri]|uniref:Sushi domain-containing protein n=3 Tax=Adineta steineri TaxID=433720 RepID=A0A813N9G1_9BILA|nr:unnamed protein product [Adineta steineri]CAF1093341.1 unnamed protein product [Adineta steineri]
MLFESIIYAIIFSLCFADFDETLIYCKTAPPKLINGLIKRDRVSYYKGQGYLGSMEYMCLPGFNLNGNKIVTCHNGVWSTMTQCIPKRRCSPIKSYPLNTVVGLTNISFFQNDPQQIVVGSTVTLRCIDNYEFDPTSNGSLIIQCQNDGTWTTMPRCRDAQAMCDYTKLYLPSRSRITRMNFKFSENNRQFHMVGSNLEYTCEEGYRLNDGTTSLIVECLSSGLWSSLPVCEYVYQNTQTVRCNYPVHVENGFITVYNVTIWEDQTYTGTITYECNYGFETVYGRDQIMTECLNGIWTNVTSCQEIPTCPKQDLLDIESQVENSYVYNVSLQYIRDPLAFVYSSYVLRTCLPNFEHDPLSPPLKIQCQRDTHTWTGIPICRKIESMTTEMTITENNEPSIEIDNLIMLKENSTNNQSQTTIETESSTIVFDTTHTIVCYSNEIPYIPNSVIIQLQSNITYDVGTTLVYICQPGYESLFNQSSFTTCSMNGTWSIDTINITMCQLSSITTEETFFNTSTVSSNITDENKNITVNLDENLPIMNLSNETLTSEIRSISAGDREVLHIISYCKELPQIEHAQLLRDDTIKHNFNNEITYSGSLEFICQFGFISENNKNEPFQVTCRNGVFYPKIFCIEKPRCLLPPSIDMSRNTIINSAINVFDTSTNEAIPGSFILLKCFDKTNDENSNFNITCLENGQWLLPPSSCIVPFQRRCQSGITIPNARTRINAKLTTDGYYNDGSRAAYQCLENFVHDPQSGPIHIQCKNGRWGPRPRCIPNGCTEPMSDTIENGWKSAESFIIYNDIKYYKLTRYSCREKAILVDSSSRVIDIECRNNKWEYKSLPACQLEE